MQVKTLPMLLHQINVRSKARVNPYANLADEIIEHTCRKLGIWLPHLQHYTTMSYYLFPTTSLQRLVTLGIYFNVMFYIDDQYDRHHRDEVNVEQEIKLRKLFDNCTNIWLNGYVPSDSHVLYDACAELRKQFLALTSEGWMRRFVTSNLSHLKASTYRLEDIAHNHTDIVKAYIDLRLLDAGMYPMIDTLEFARNIMLPDDVLNSEYLYKLRTSVAIIGALMNDLFSYTKEIMGTNSRFNLICVLEDYADYPFEDAVQKSIDIINDEIDTFYDLAYNIPSWDDKRIDKDVKIYIDGLIDEVVACWHWQVSTNRYRSENSPFPELRVEI